jgi:ferredoxin
MPECRHCHHPNDADAAYCDSCGMRLPDEAERDYEQQQPPALRVGMRRWCMPCRDWSRADRSHCFHCGSPLSTRPEPIPDLAIGMIVQFDDMRGRIINGPDASHCWHVRGAWEHQDALWVADYFLSPVLELPLDDWRFDAAWRARRVAEEGRG